MTIKLPTIKKGICPKCSIPIKADTLFVDKDIYGYKSTDHGCGEEYTLIVFLVTNEDILPRENENED